MNRFQRDLPPELFRELFRRVPWALFAKLTPQQESEVLEGIVRLRDELQRKMMRNVLSMSMEDRVQLSEDVDTLNRMLGS